MDKENPYSHIDSRHQDLMETGNDITGPRDNEKLIVIVTYILSIFMGMPIFFFLPLLAESSSSEYARVHSNNILVTFLFSLLLFVIILGVAAGLWGLAPVQSLQSFWELWVLVGGGGFMIAVSFFLLFIFEIFGFIWALQDKAQAIPLIGRIRIIR